MAEGKPVRPILIRIAAPVYKTRTGVGSAPLFCTDAPYQHMYPLQAQGVVDNK